MRAALSSTRTLRDQIAPRKRRPRPSARRLLVQCRSSTGHHGTSFGHSEDQVNEFPPLRWSSMYGVGNFESITVLASPTLDSVRFKFGSKVRRMLRIGYLSSESTPTKQSGPFWLRREETHAPVNADLPPSAGRDVTWASRSGCGLHGRRPSKIAVSHTTIVSPCRNRIHKTPE